MYSCCKYKTQVLGDEIHRKPLDTPIKSLQFNLVRYVFAIYFDLNVVLDIVPMLDKNKTDQNYYKILERDWLSAA